jgi:hypothetical protein
MKPALTIAMLIVVATGCSQPIEEEDDTAEAPVIGVLTGKERRMLLVLRSAVQPSENCIYELAWNAAEHGKKTTFGVALVNKRSVTRDDVAGPELALGSFLAVAGLVSLPFTGVFCAASVGAGCFAVAGSVGAAALGAVMTGNAAQTAEQTLDSEDIFRMKDADYRRVRNRIAQTRAHTLTTQSCAPWSSYPAKNRGELLNWAEKSLH